MKSLTKQEEHILLAIYQLKEKAYLVTIRDVLKELTGKYFDLGTIYVPLKRLNRYGYLETSIGEPTSMRGGKAIKYYRLTSKGYEVLAELKQIHDKLWQDFALPAGIK